MTKKIYLLHKVHEQLFKDVQRRIELARITGQSLVLLTLEEFRVYTSAVRITVEVPTEKPYVAEDHQEILERFRKHCSDFADYLEEYDAKDPFGNNQIRDLTWVVELAQDFTDSVKNHLDLLGSYDMYHLTRVRRTAD